MAEAEPARTLGGNGRCCGRKPVYYRGGAWNSPVGSPMHFCTRCNREYGPDLLQRPNWAWQAVPGGFTRRTTHT